MIIKQPIKANEIDRMYLVGNASGLNCLIVDAMIDTAGTLGKASQHLSDHAVRRLIDINPRCSLIPLDHDLDNVARNPCSEYRHALMAPTPWN
ncbi:hypothetical protein, variant [Aphanomyces invadans]|uniref:Uncharacterized protein n=1 Tax=Aphanomyces invadans TaxID=157072 RepID=A0A024TZK0_9STRA|nr:hypothetical protein H310_08257 [Aphanomyces invadans]XP_008872162.1 hypothetical protein, variant [Aphanomyces invadans]ETV99605.1 hypothetical protein H310_08257 [Aphanomyces invadans]ETV99606.1 hypothetical protein, variant [Aphanomyces invadans]|eukprot:XP_008872161.1 hypothetical protein H310_08257 [Aphanomyces invadans]